MALANYFTDKVNINYCKTNNFRERENRIKKI